jgi:outer membrane usher protein
VARGSLVPLRAGACSLAVGVASLGTPAWGRSPAAQATTVPPAGTPPASPLPTPAAAQAVPAADEIKLNKTGRTMTIVVSLKDGQRVLGDVDAQITPDDTLLVSVEGLVQLLGRSLAPASLDRIRQAQAAEGFASLPALNAQGLDARFDKRAFELTVTIAVAARATRTIGLADLDRAVVGEFTPPERFSAYVNVRGSVDVIHRGGPQGFGDPFVLLDGAMRLAPVVLEAEGSFNGLDRRFDRSGARLVFDDSRRLVRWTAGDLLGESRGFQGQVDIAGIGVRRSYALLDPQRNVAPRGGRTFSIDRDATVDAFVNGRAVRTLRLQPGTYNVSDFPFAQGGNDVQLVIVDDAGRRETISFTTFIERTQLAPGLSEFSVDIGAVSRRDRGIAYSGTLAGSGFYRRGISERLTVGGNAQFAGRRVLVGAEAVLGAGFGTIGGDVAVSYLPAAGTGWAANFSIERLTQRNERSSSFLAAVELRSRRFGAVEQFTPDNPYDANVSASYNASLDRNSFAGAQLRYAHGRGGIVDEYSARGTYGRRLGRTMNLILDVEWSRGVRGDDRGARVSLVRRFGDRTSARAEFDGRDQRVRLGVQSSGGYGIGSWSGGANADLGDDAISVNASANYVANRADLGVAHTAAFSPDGGGITDQRTSFRAGTSIAFAGGQVAVGRPISDGFALVRSYRGGTENRVVVEPAQGSAQARSGVLGPALFSQVTSYSPRTLTYDAPGAPSGLDLGTGSLRVLAPYRAGYVVTVGSEYGMMAIGTLRLLREPLPLRAGFALEVGPGGRRVELFTNRQGQFSVAGLKPGRWRIEIAGTPKIVYEMIVPDAADGIARIGVLNPIDER